MGTGWVPQGGVWWWDDARSPLCLSVVIQNVVQSPDPHYAWVFRVLTALEMPVGFVFVGSRFLRMTISTWLIGWLAAHLCPACLQDQDHDLFRDNKGRLTGEHSTILCIRNTLSGH